MRKQLLLGALTAFGLSFTTQLAAQQNDYLKCGTAEALKKMYAENPQLEADFYHLLQQNKEVRTEKGKTREVYIVPIVFHVIHQYGSENVTDAQIYDQMEILNEDFRRKNSDTSAIIPQYKPIAADAQIEFRLASIDPQGNCTNGIDHIYSHNTNLANDYSKLNQWHRSRYLNVWVVNTIGSSGVAGYAYYPTATTGSSYWIDGIIILNDYIGSIGTGSPYSSRALTHEIGHFLSLPHTWGSTNDPEVACGDDGIDDTPETAGHNNCNNLYDDECNPGVVENVQNFMEYSYCSRMYTADQATVMQNTLASDVSSRNFLVSDTNHILTGTNYSIDPEDRTPCAPEADFNPDNFMVCAGSIVNFRNFTWRGAATSYSWSFPGGSPATSTSANPAVTYSEPGFYNVTLTATNESGSTTLTKQNVIYIAPSWQEHVGPFNVDFNNDQGYFITQDLGNSFSKWTRVEGVGKDLTPCFKLNNYKDVSNAEMFSDDYFYYNRLAGAKDNLISPAYDLRSTTGVSISFDYSYGSRTTDLADMTDKLVVYSSRDCGKTWTLRKTIQKADLLTSGYVGAVDYAPTSNNQWKTVTIPYTVTNADERTRFKIEYTASNFSSNLYIDNFNVSGVLGIDELSEMSQMLISPNPVQQGSDIAIEIASMTEPMTLQIVNMEGKVVATHVINPVNAVQTVNIPMNVAKGCYMINASQGSARSTNRVIVF